MEIHKNYRWEITNAVQTRAMTPIGLRWRDYIEVRWVAIIIIITLTTTLETIKGVRISHHRSTVSNMSNILRWLPIILNK